jgi:hypothetical protein
MINKINKERCSINAKKTEAKLVKKKYMIDHVLIIYNLLQGFNIQFFSRTK